MHKLCGHLLRYLGRSQPFTVRNGKSYKEQHTFLTLQWVEYHKFWTKFAGLFPLEHGQESSEMLEVEGVVGAGHLAPVPDHRAVEPQVIGRGKGHKLLQRTVVGNVALEIHGGLFSCLCLL